MNNPEYAKVGNKKYKINTDYRIAIKCQEIALDEKINDYERALAIIYTLFGDEGINTPDDYEKLLEIAKKYLSCGKELSNSKEEADMDYIQDMDLIETSFMSDYGIDLQKSNMHWWKFYNHMNGLSNSELGNCCVLNRVRNLRNIDLKKIKDFKEREKIRKAQEEVALKRNKKINARPLTKEQQESIRKFYELTGIDRKE